MKKLIGLVCLLLISNVYAGDIKNVETTLYKKSDFEYEQVITVQFKSDVLLDKNEELFNVKNYALYPQESFDDDNFELVIYPIKVKPLVVKAGVKLWVKLNRDKAYVLVVKGNILKYVNGESVQGGTVKNIKLKDKYHKYLEQKPIFDFKSSVLSLDASGLDVACDFTASHSWKLGNWLLNGSIDGRVATEKTLYFDTLEFSGGVKKNLYEFDYLPLFVTEKAQTTQNFDKVDLVTNIGTDFILPLSLSLSSVQFSPFPIITIGYEAGWKLNDGMFINRATLGFDWKIPMGKTYVFTVDFRPYYKPVEVNQYSYFVSVALDKKIDKDVNLIVINYSRGSLPPKFVEQEKFFTGVNVKLQ